MVLHIILQLCAHCTEIKEGTSIVVCKMDQNKSNNLPVGIFICKARITLGQHQLLGPQARMVLSSSRTWNGWLWLKQTQGLFQSDGIIQWPEHTWKFDLSVLLYNLYLQNTEEEEFL